MTDTTLIFLIIILVFIVVIGFPSTYLAYKTIKICHIVDKKDKERSHNAEVTRVKYITSDSQSLDLIQNDPWEFNDIIIGVPTFLSTISEFKDLSVVLEEHNIKFISSDLRNHGWKGKSGEICLGTILQDTKELINQVTKYYPDANIYLLGQGFGGQLAYYVNKQLRNTKGVIIANPLYGTSGINFFEFTNLSYKSEIFRLKPKVQHFKIKKTVARMDKLTNNTGYKRENKELWERKYTLGVNISYIAQTRTVIDYFWKNVRQQEQNLLWISTTEDAFQETEKNASVVETLGNHLVFTDYVNDDTIKCTINWLKAQKKDN